MQDTPKRDSNASRRDKARTLWPLPGGSGGYLRALNCMLEIVTVATDTDDAVARIVDIFHLTSLKTARSYLAVVSTLGFVEVVGPSLYLTAEGRKQRDNPEPLRVRRALVGRVAGCSELLKVLRRRPLRMAAVAEQMSNAGFKWSTHSQVRYRLRWLEEVGAVERYGQGRPEYRLVPKV